MTLDRELELARKLALEAGEIARRLQAVGIKVDRKAGNEPVTQADRDASDHIVRALAEAFPDDSILSEEAPPDATRFTHPRVWMVDPIDGTKDFIRGEDGYATMIGLLIGDEPALGAVYQPIGDRLYFAAVGAGAWFSEKRATPVRMSTSTIADPEQIRMVASKSHRGPEIDRVRQVLKISDELNVGSVGLKMGLIARGVRDLYVNPSSHAKLWDTCGPEAILREAGGRVTDACGRPLNYRGEALGHLSGIIASNGALHATVVEKLAPLFKDQ